MRKYVRKFLSLHELQFVNNPQVKEEEEEKRSQKIPFPAPAPSIGVISVICFGVYPFILFSVFIKSYAIIFPPLWSFFLLYYTYTYHFLITILLGPNFFILHLLLMVALYSFIMFFHLLFKFFSIGGYLNFYQCLALQTMLKKYLCINVHNYIPVFYFNFF